MRPGGPGFNSSLSCEIAPESPTAYSGVDATTPLTAPPVASLQGKKRKASSMKVERQIHSRSDSIPSIRGGPVMAESEADKKRNKLGYQRISIACSHCRRRKIRCLVAEDDPAQRCQNCIRLKKECVFYPVDQQNVMDNRSQGSGKAGGSAVSSSPQGSEHGTFQGLHTPVTGTFQGLPVEPNSAMPVQEAEYGYRHGHQELGHAGGWSQEGAPGSAGMPPPVSPANPYWRYSQPGAPTQQYEYQARGQYSNPYPHGLPPPGQMTSRYPPASLDVQSASMLTQPGGPRSAPVGPPHMPYSQQPPYMVHHEQHNAPPPPQQHGSYPPPGQPGYQQGGGGGWYGHGPGHYPPMEEEPPHGYHQGRPS